MVFFLMQQCGCLRNTAEYKINASASYCFLWQLGQLLAGLHIVLWSPCRKLTILHWPPFDQPLLVCLASPDDWKLCSCNCYFVKIVSESLSLSLDSKICIPYISNFKGNHHHNRHFKKSLNLSLSLTHTQLNYFILVHVETILISFTTGKGTEMVKP